MTYAAVDRTIWAQPEVRRLTPNERLLLVYFLASDRGNMIGVFVCPPAFAAYYTGIPIEEVLAAVQGPLSMLLDYDPDTEEVFVHNAARLQVSEVLQAGDKRRPKILNQVSSIISNRLRDLFLKRYSDWGLNHTQDGASGKGHSGGQDGASVAVRMGQPTETEAETEAEAQTGAAREVFDVFVKERKVHVPRALDLKPTKARLARISARLAEGLTLDQATDVARGIFYAENHVRDNWKDSTIDVAFRSMENCERFMKAFCNRSPKSSDDSLAQSRAEMDALKNAGACSE